MAKIKHLFTQKTTTLLGLDIGASAVKLLEISADSHRFRLESYAIEPVVENSAVASRITNPKAVGKALQQSILKSGTKLNRAAVALSDSKVIRKIIKMPASLSAEEMESRIHLEADQFISFPLDNISLDFEVQGINSVTPELMDVFLVACRTTDVDMCVSALKMGGLICDVVDIEANAVESAMNLIADQLPDAGFGKLVAVIDMGATKTKITVLHDMKVMHSREQSLGGQALSEKIQAYFGLSYEEAECAKCQGGLPKEYLSEVLEPFKKAMVSQVVCGLRLFFSVHSFNTIDHVVLTGGCSLINGMEQLIQEALGVPTSIANPFSTLSISPKINLEQLTEDSSFLMLACGLALRGFQQNGDD